MLLEHDDSRNDGNDDVVSSVQRESTSSTSIIVHTMALEHTTNADGKEVDLSSEGSIEVVEAVKSDDSDDNDDRHHLVIIPVAAAGTTPRREGDGRHAEVVEVDDTNAAEDDDAVVVVVEAVAAASASAADKAAAADNDNDKDKDDSVIVEADSEPSSVLEDISSFVDSSCSGACQCSIPKSVLRNGPSWSGVSGGGTTASTKSLTSSCDEQEKNRRGVMATAADRVVSFSQLEIREFNMTLGDHPSSSSGPPVRLDWNAEEPASQRVVDVDEYERGRMPRRCRRQLKLSCRDRRSILQGERGFSDQEVIAAWEEAMKIRKQRQETNNRGAVMMTLDDMWESACRKYNRLLDSL